MHKQRPHTPTPKSNTPSQSPSLRKSNNLELLKTTKQYTSIAQNLSINYCKETKHLYCFYDKKDAFMTCKTSQRCFEVTNRKLLKI
uniref:Uncharacterized protein n=1 Tax=Populus trichocarpa TaxID=3694 RepID=A0A2K2A0N6_POPTR